MKLDVKDYTMFFTDLHMINVILFLIFIDIVLGVSVAIVINKNFMSKSAYIGYLKKMGILVSIVISNVLDIILDLEGSLIVATVWFYVVYEASSIFEHLAAMGVPLPDRFVDVLEVMRNKSRKDD